MVSDFCLLKRILRYVKGTLEYGFTLRNMLHCFLLLTMIVTGLVVNKLDDQQRLSVFYLDATYYPGMPKSSRLFQGSLLKRNIEPSIEAEYRDLRPAAQEITWISSLLRDIGITRDQAIILMCDNLSAVYLSANLTLHNRSKHFDTDYHYIREQAVLGLIETRHILASQ